MLYLTVKVFHIVMFTSWFAGLFYLPRIFVNLAMVEDKSTYQHLLVMASKLYRFVTPIMYLTILAGGWMIYLIPDWLSASWMHAKLVLVLILVGYHYHCGVYLKRFQQNQVKQGHVFFRWFNELPVILLVAIVLLAILKPFY